MELKDGTYHLQGVTFRELASRFGTPLYIYDAATIRRQVTALRNAFKRIQIKYAMKALSNLSILKFLRQEGVGVDVVSIQEAQLALRAGYQPSEILYTPNSVAFAEVETAVTTGLTVNIDNLVILEKFGRRYGATYPCFLRINPHIMAGGNLKISTGHRHSKFGISVEQRDELLALVRQYDIQVHGIHIHTGSEILALEVFQKMAVVLLDLARNIPTVKVADFGGGIKVPFKPGESGTDLPGLGAMLDEDLARFEKETGRSLELWMEPGKFLVSEAGYLLVTVNVVKRTPDVTFVGVDSGLNQLIRPMMYDAYHEIVNVSNPDGAKKTYTVVGNVCETDTLGSDRQLSEVREGDLLVLKNAGAYGYSMASNYNSRFRPAEVLIIQGEARLIRHRDTLDQLLAGQEDIF